MSKAEIALQLTLKAMDDNRIGLDHPKESYMDNARKICEFYNELVNNLQVGTQQ